MVDQDLCPQCARNTLVLEVWANDGGRIKCRLEDCGWWEPASMEDDGDASL